MSKKGFLKIRFHSVDCNKVIGKECQVRARSGDAQITVKLSHEESAQNYHYFPMTEKIQLFILGDKSAQGYFELPIKKLYDYPFKKHLIEVNCVTRDPHEGSVKPEVFGVVKVSLIYLEDQVAKLDVFIKGLRLTEAKSGLDRELYLECTVGNVSSQTTVKKRKEETIYEWDEILPFTLEAVPGKIEITIKDKDMVNDQVMGKTVIDPQKEHIFEATGKKQRDITIDSGDRTIILNLSTNFKIHQQK